MIIILAGSIGRFPVGGHAWVEMQYLLGLRALGHEVFYLEDCGEGSWVYNWESEEITTDLDYPTDYIRMCLEPIGFGDRWTYRAGDKAIGIPIDKFRSICSNADLFIVRNCRIDPWREDYNWPRRRVYIDSDPGFTQIHLANGYRDFVTTVKHCDRLFTVGPRIGSHECPIPQLQRHWIPTVPPVSLPNWPVCDSPATHFTTIMQWKSRKEVSYDGVTYGNKNREFSKFSALPGHTTQRFRIAVTRVPPQDVSQLSQQGWEVEIGWRASKTPWTYQQFIQKSRAEFAVAKHLYVQTRGGWFSDRSACYIACGKPVLVQDTGQSDWLRTGEGILTFRDLDEALKGIESINSNYERHCRAARSLAEEYFATEQVLPRLLQEAMN
jgi:hypothetical protein